jgi:hypothetical protein
MNYENEEDLPLPEPPEEELDPDAIPQVPLGSLQESKFTRLELMRELVQRNKTAAEVPRPRPPQAKLQSLLEMRRAIEKMKRPEKRVPIRLEMELKLKEEKLRSRKERQYSKMLSQCSDTELC